jgi:hypothetical protein
MKTYTYELAVLHRRKRKPARILHSRVYKVTVGETPRDACDLMAMAYLSEHLREAWKLR